MESVGGRLPDPHQLPLLTQGKDGIYSVTWRKLYLVYPIHFRDGGAGLIDFMEAQLRSENCTIKAVASLQNIGSCPPFSPDIQTYTSVTLDLRQNGSTSIRIQGLAWAKYCGLIPCVRLIKPCWIWEGLYAIHRHGTNMHASPGSPYTDPPSDSVDSATVVNARNRMNRPIENLAQWLDIWAHITKLVDPTIDPHKTPIGSHKKAWFICRHCGHRHCTVIRYVTRAGHYRCGYCAPSGKICQNVTSCDFCRGRRFINHWRASYSLEDPDLLAMLTMSTHRLVRFRCDEGHDFEASPSTVTHGSWCIQCQNKTEALITAFLAASPLNFVRQEHVPNPNGIRPFRVDWSVTVSDGLHVVIELDGGQHFHPIDHWGGSNSFAVGRARDIYKMIYFLNLRRRIIRLKQEDVLIGSFDWQSQLRNALLYGQDLIIYLEKDPSKDSWRELRAQMTYWWGINTETWLSMNASHLLSAPR
jgi:hypothetical protein